MEKYKRAFGEVFGATARFDFEILELPEGGTLQRMNVRVPKKRVSDVPALLDLQARAYDLIRKESPELLGYFAVRFRGR